MAAKSGLIVSDVMDVLKECGVPIDHDEKPLGTRYFSTTGDISLVEVVYSEPYLKRLLIGYDDQPVKEVEISTRILPEYKQQIIFAEETPVSRLARKIGAYPQVNISKQMCFQVPSKDLSIGDSEFNKSKLSYLILDTLGLVALIHERYGELVPPETEAQEDIIDRSSNPHIQRLSKIK